MFGFERLEVWRKSISFADRVYTITRKFPTEEKFGLTVQLRRAAVSIAANLAEGSSRSSKRDFQRFVEISYGSLMEVISHLTIAKHQRFLKDEEYVELYQAAEELVRMLSGLRGSLQ